MVDITTAGGTGQADYPLRVEIDSGQKFVQCVLIPMAIADAQTEAYSGADECGVLHALKLMQAEEMLRGWINEGKIQLFDAFYAPVRFFHADIYSDSDQIPRQDLQKLLNSLNIGLVIVEEAPSEKNAPQQEPRSGAQEPGETPEDRDWRIARDHKRLMGSSHPSPTKEIAAQEGISERRVRQILERKRERSKPNNPADWRMGGRRSG